MSTPFHDRLLLSTTGKLHCILRAACGRNEPGLYPLIAGKFTITSDGFVMADFIDGDGYGHHGAFIGSWDDLAANVRGLADHMDLNKDDRAALAEIILGWVAADYRARPGFDGVVSALKKAEKQIGEGRS